MPWCGQRSAGKRAEVFPEVKGSELTESEATAQLGFAESLLIDRRQRCESTAEPKARFARSFELRFTSVADVVGARIIRARHLVALLRSLSATSNYKKNSRLVAGSEAAGCLAHLGGNIRAARAQSFRCAARELRRQGGQTACGHRGGTVHKKWIRLENGSRQIAGFSFCLNYDTFESMI